MKGVDILASFELEINKINDTVLKPLTDDSLYWINQAIIKFVKDRFNGNGPKRTSYEQNEKRTRDLINLFCEKTITNNENLDEYIDETSVYYPDNEQFKNIDTENKIVLWYEVYSGNENKEYIKNINLYNDNEKSINKTVHFVKESFDHPLYDSYEYIYPKDMMFVLNEDVIICDTNNEYKTDACIFECTSDSFMYRINNSLTDFHYRFHKARPLRVRTKDGFRLLTDKNYKIYQYTLGYLKVPEEIKGDNPYTDYKDFEEYIWLEIIKIAAQMYIENQQDPRYKTLTNEVLTQE